ncbi:short chain dehydrogenase [Mycolicibacter sinensis]|jgi:citronellol/citronellal dehydrogenase|uniref:Short chain dehydrogenase n=1 Tax=Mycolicibacter sinensis (strain JDM601) TaxID=875328 RepID=F5Z348_MYCSD|nr:short chain dehydrogenase [Mycolicibacter sinensis]OBG03118.1 hypothetical protein A5771_14410 [Mycolicibacter sinensis]OBG04320.1 hypothetical protein A5772_05425 [Mycolicibacter sinensis]
MTTYTGKTMFISGASRGIGLAIANRVAAEGADIALLAKTADPHPKLPPGYQASSTTMAGAF